MNLGSILFPQIPKTSYFTHSVNEGMTQLELSKMIFIFVNFIDV